jgi:hypothetical protein
MTDAPKPLMPQLALLIAVTLFSMLAFTLIRIYVVEPDEMAAACSGQAIAMICKIRNAAVFGFSRELFSPIALVAAALGWVGAMRAFALVAIISGTAGMALYDYQLSGFGMLLGTVLFLHLCLRDRVTQLGK